MHAQFKQLQLGLLTPLEDCQCIKKPINGEWHLDFLRPYLHLGDFGSYWTYDHEIYTRCQYSQPKQGHQL